MNIGIDIDGVLCSEDLFQLTYGLKYCLEKGLKCLNLSPFSPETKTRFHWSAEEDWLFWKTSYFYYLTTSEFIYPYAVEFIQNLYQNGHNIYFISQRSQTLLNELEIPENMEQLTKNWLHKNHIPFHQLILTENSKQPFIQELNISIMIDDNPELLIALSKYIDVIGFRAHCNIQYSFPDIPIVSSWKELEYQFKVINIRNRK